MTYIAITVGATSKLLLHRSSFSEGETGRPLAELLTTGKIAEFADWTGYAIHAKNGLTCIALPNEGNEKVLLMSADAWSHVGTREDMLRIADRAFRTFVTIAHGSSPNKSWHRYTAGSLLSVFANPNRETEHRRVCFELAKKNEFGVVALYAIRPLELTEDLASYPPSEIFNADLSRLAPGLRQCFGLATPVASHGSGGVIEDHFTGAEYEKTVAENIALNRTYATWREKLNDEQSAFVSSSIQGPIRLHGPAGTGKTLCLLLKVLAECTTATQEHRIVLFAHSQTMADALATALDVLDPGTQIRSGSPASVEVRTLFDWCLNFLGDELKPGQLLDRDATESREFQREILLASLERTAVEQWAAHRQNCSPDFRAMIENERNASWFLTLLQHELACVLKGNRIQPFNLQMYLDLNRPNRALPIHSEGDRRFVFATYKMYEEELKEFGVFDVDDIVVEVLGRLESPLWSRQRQGSGYDTAFIDEAHLLNDNERSLMRFLLKDAFGVPRIVMGLDLLQTVGDRGVREDSHGRLVTQTTEYDTERSELNEVHRSSKEILDLAQAVVTCGSELYEYSLSVGQRMGGAVGEIPMLYSCNSLEAQAESAFAIAKRWSKKKKWSKHEIALICATDDVMNAVLERANTENKPVRVIDRRGDQEAYADAKRFSCYVVVTPEFSAGLQFRGVVLLDVSQGRVPDYRSSVAGARSAMMRRSVSEIYLALTRARERVAVLIDETAGPSELLKPAIEASYLIGSQK